MENYFEQLSCQVALNYEDYREKHYASTIKTEQIITFIKRGFIIGERGSGRTQLLKTILQKTQQNKRPALYLDLAEISKGKAKLEQVVFENASDSRLHEAKDLLCIDNFDEPRTSVSQLREFLERYPSISFLLAITPETLREHSWLNELKSVSYLVMGNAYIDESIEVPNESMGIRYWAGGFGKGGEFYDRLEDFKQNNYWQALDYEDVDDSVAIQAWELFGQISIGDHFLIKGYGGSHDLTVHYVGKVTSKNEAIGRLDFEKQQVILYKGKAPRGEGAGIWFNTLLEVYRPDDIKLLFLTPLSEEETIDSNNKGTQNTGGMQNTEGGSNPENPKSDNVPDGGIVYEGTSRFSVSEGDEGVNGVNELALVMANLLKNLKENDKGKMVGIFGNWGRGKTFLMEKVWQIFQKDESKPFIKVSFHAWKYQDTPASWAYLYEAFAKEYFRSGAKNRISRKLDSIAKLLQLNYQRLGLTPVLTFLLIITGSILGYKFTKDISHTMGLLLFFGGLSLSALQVLQIVRDSFSTHAKALFKKYYTKTSFVNLLGVQAEIQNELKLLLKTWLPETEEKEIGQRILLFVDDIDRCSEDKIMMIIDALRIMLEDEEISRRVVVLSAIDERVLKRAIKWKYHDLLMKDCEIGKTDRKNLSQSITGEYMDKLFLSGISLGALSFGDRQRVLSKYIQGRVYKETPQQKPGAGEAGTVDKPLLNALRELTEIEKKKNEPEKKPAEGKADDRTTNASATQASTTRIIDSDKYDLTEDEEQLLSGLMKHHVNATPRQIRIFYYRYLLARNILIMRLALQGQKIKRSQSTNLSLMLMHYTILSNSISALRETKLRLADDSSYTPDGLFLGQTLLFGEGELSQLLEVLEVVIAY